MMLTLYGLKNCDSCRKAQQWLHAHALAFEFVDIRNTPADASQLQQWQQRAGGWNALINTASATWRGLSAEEKVSQGDSAWLALLQRYPALIKRPLLVLDDGTLLQGFSVARYQAVFAKNAGA